MGHLKQDNQELEGKPGKCRMYVRMKVEVFLRKRESVVSISAETSRALRFRYVHDLTTEQVMAEV